MSHSLAGTSARRFGSGRLSRRLLRLARARLGATLALAVLAAFALAVLARPIVWPHAPTAADTANLLAGPSLRHPFGTDENGYDIVARVVDGARYAFAVPLAALALAIAVGAPLGLVAGLRGGVIDSLFRRILQGVALIPPLLLAMALVAAMGPALRHVVIAIGLLQAAVFARAMRDEVRALHDRGFIEGAVATGNRLPRLILVHLLPNMLARIAGEIPRQASWALGTLAALGFVGVATSAASTEWGTMIRTGAEALIAGQWWLATFPGLALLLFGGALRLLAESVDGHSRYAATPITVPLGQGGDA